MCCIHAVGDKQGDCLKSSTTVLSFRLSDLWLGQPVQSTSGVLSSHMASSSGRSALHVMAVLDNCHDTEQLENCDLCLSVADVMLLL